ncbi:NAD(+) synthase [Belliella kenyensis]|uniref:Glutamine-dependent NAD(+) synthetase n=1 Tax=Belliella kenyensis TaxID=1472724 RepID=A0ABV8EMR3_9BACT|nr:NAD(+) synthase [Belliella kenyensis]MCH7402958.1 NAD(+) synthase [Belliella kenyensis]MDN3604994.1 NAD(+) synthase [Belliella kenyensis]
MSSKLKIALATVNQTPLDWKGNIKNISRSIDEAKSRGVELLCFPELAITGYGSEDLFLSYWYPQKALEQLKQIIPMCENITIAVGLPVRIQEVVYNCIAVVENKQLMGFVAKQFMAIDGVHYEFRWFTPWKANETTSYEFDGECIPFGDIIFEKNGLRYGFEICEDAWRGKLRPGYRLKEKKIDLIFNPSASHFAMGKSKTREDLVCFSSKEFDATYFYINLLGNESGKMIFDGETLISKAGKLIFKNRLLSFEDYQVSIFEYDHQKSNYPEITSSHDKNQEFVQAASLGLFDYLRKSRSSGFVLSLSGGADSSSIAILVAEMVKRGVAELGIKTFLSKLNLKIEKLGDDPSKDIMTQILTTAYQGTENSSKETFESAKLLAKSIGATFYDWEIGTEVKSYTQKIEKAIGRKLTWDKDDLALQNIQARSRSPIIWMLANIKNALLLTTSNRSEGDVGYATMDGDTSGSISPIAGVDKAFILQWLRWAENELGHHGLKYVNALQPSAELRPLDNHQTDEDDLMPYPTILEIEKLAIKDKRSPIAIYLILKDELGLEDELLKSYIRKFFRLWSRNQWKRERIAPSFHLDEFSVDPRSWYRFPILSGGFEVELEELDSY